MHACHHRSWALISVLLNQDHLVKPWSSCYTKIILLNHDHLVKPSPVAGEHWVGSHIVCYHISVKSCDIPCSHEFKLLVLENSLQILIYPVLHHFPLFFRYAHPSGLALFSYDAGNFVPYIQEHPLPVNFFFFKAIYIFLNGEALLSEASSSSKTIILE